MARMLRSATLVLLCFFAGMRYGQEASPYGRTLDGHAVLALGEPQTKAAVLFFVATDCPVSNRTFPEMKRVREEFSGQGIRLWFVYPNAGELAASVRDHQRAYDADGDVLLDPTGALTRLAGAKVTPEVAILIPTSGHVNLWTPVYVGRIDNRYVRLGLERPQATEHFAERVVREVLDGRPVERATGSPVGCGIIAPQEVSAVRGKQ